MINYETDDARKRLRNSRCISTVDDNVSNVWYYCYHIESENAVRGPRKKIKWKKKTRGVETQVYIYDGNMIMRCRVSGSSGDDVRLLAQRTWALRMLYYRWPDRAPLTSSPNRHRGTALYARVNWFGAGKTSAKSHRVGVCVVRERGDVGERVGGGRETV